MGDRYCAAVRANTIIIHVIYGGVAVAVNVFLIKLAHNGLRMPERILLGLGLSFPII